MGVNTVQEVKTIVDLSRSYRRHIHDEVSIVHVWSGSTIAWIDGKDVPISGECVVVIPAGVPHACNPSTPGDWSYTMILVDSMVFPGAIPFRILPSHEHLWRPFSILRAGAKAPCENERLALEILLGLDDNLADGAKQAYRPCAPKVLRSIEAFLRNNVASPLSLDDLSETAGLSKYHLVRSFKNAFGLTPHAYHLNLRVNTAKARLKRGENLAEIALDCGFCDQSHLNRVFTRCVGMTPAAYQNAIAISSKTRPSRHS